MRNKRLYVLALVISIVYAHWLWQQTNRVETVPYSEFQNMLESNRLSEVIVEGDLLRAQVKDPGPEDARFIETIRVDSELAEDIMAHGVRLSAKTDSEWLVMVLSWILPAVFFVSIWFFLFRRITRQSGGGGLLSIGKSNAKVYIEQDTKVTFEDVAGVDEAKEELQEIVAFLKDPGEYGRLGAHIPNGVLLVGPPGTGKTLLARAVAGEAGVPFFTINGSEFVEMFVGVGAARVRDLFTRASQNAPCIVFIDELDALGRARSAGPLMGGHDEKEQTLNQLLSELDGFDNHEGVVLLAATNRPETLDPALLRSGRFDRQVLVDRPDKAGRIAILRIHVRKVPLAPSMELEQVAALTPGFSGADLANLVNEATIVATRKNASLVTLEDFVAAIERIVAGLEKKNRLLNDHEREVVAYHEMGHALISMLTSALDRVQKVSIIPRGIGAVGYNLQHPTEDRYLMTEQELKTKLMVLLGGRAAEQVIFGEISTGAANDLEAATKIARGMVMSYGMDERLGAVTYSSQASPFLEGVGEEYGFQSLSEATSAAIDEAVRALLEEALSGARSFLQEKESLLRRGAQILLEQETLTREELEALVSADHASLVSLEPI